MGHLQWDSGRAVYRAGGSCGKSIAARISRSRANGSGTTPGSGPMRIVIRSGAANRGQAPSASQLGSPERANDPEFQNEFRSLLGLSPRRLCAETARHGSREPLQRERRTQSTRRRILELLRERDLTAGEIAEHFPQKKPTLSKHFTVLKDADLIQGTRNGTSITYTLNVSVLEEALLSLMNTFQFNPDSQDE